MSCFTNTSSITKCALDHRSLPPEFESRRLSYLKGVSSLTSLNYLWRSLGPFSLPCAQSSRKTSIVIIISIKRNNLVPYILIVFVVVFKHICICISKHLHLNIFLFKYFSMHLNPRLDLLSADGILLIHYWHYWFIGDYA